MKAGPSFVKLGEIADVQSGGTPSISNKTFWSGSIPWYSSGELNTVATTDPERTVSNEGILGSNAKVFPVGSLLIGMYDTAALKMSILDRDAAFNQAIAGVKPNVDVSMRYVYYALTANKEALLGQRRGVRQKNLSLGKVRDFLIPLCSLPEQQRIVAILDDAFDSIAIAKTHAEANLQNARAIFDSQLQSIFAKRGEGWCERLLGDVAEVHSGGTPTVSKKEYWNGTISWYSSGELNQTLTSDPERKISSTGLTNSNAKLFPSGSLLIGMYDTAALKMSILDRDGAFNQAIAGVKPNEHIEMEFILHAINAVKPKLLLERRGVRQKNLSLTKIKNVSIPLPSLVAQRSVVSTLREFANEIDYLESIYRQKLTALEDLKKSLLHQAFSGQL